MGVTCADCGKEIESNRIYCMDCAERHRKESMRKYYNKNRESIALYRYERYQWLRSHNICVACARADAMKDSVYCPECYKKATEARHRFNQKKKADAR